MNCSVRRVQCSDIVEIVGNRAHLHHTVSVVRCQALNLGASKVANNLATLH